MNQSSINFGFEARYFQLGEVSHKTKNLIFVLHGHGQQAKYFLRKFKFLSNEENCIVAPEGLSRYYLQGFSGRVGATWMTKEERLTDIKNYVNYLNAIYEKFHNKASPNTKVNLLGFSQGAATASRWAISGLIPLDRLILWAGIFPPDLNLKSGRELLADKEIIYAYGLQDPLLTRERLTEMQAISSELGVSPAVVAFQGKHELNEKVLGQLFL